MLNSIDTIKNNQDGVMISLKGKYNKDDKKSLTMCFN